MELNIFKKKDPVCGMKEEKGKGITREGNWFCCKECLNEYDKDAKSSNKSKKGCCC